MGGESPGTDELDAPAKTNFPGVSKISEAIGNDSVNQIITAAIAKTNSDGKLVPNNSFKIQKFTILPTNFSEEAGELTPTKKLKRAIVEKFYQKMVDKMYETEGTYIKFEKL